MAYKKTLWNDNDVPYIDAHHLNNMDKGIEKLIRKDGGKMIGSLLLTEEPVQDNEAVSKKYVEKHCEECISKLPFGSFPIFR